jgi:hypothetical protein
MSRRPEPPPPELMALLQELLDAHLDTAELAQEMVLEEDWEAHLDYLRTLQRRGHELLAGLGSQLTHR